MIDLLKFSRFQGQHARYRFDPSAKTFDLVKCETHQEADRGSSGVADQRMVGLLRRRMIFVALYLFEGSLTLLLGERTFEFPGPFRVRRRSLFPLVKSFEVWEGSRILLRLKYLYRDNYDFPGPQSTDIFLFFEKALHNAAEVERTIYWSRASAEGRNVYTSEFLKEVDEHLLAQGLVNEKRRGKPFW